eukprot:UN25745
MPRSRALESIGKNLETQYKRWQPRARVTKCLDPCKETLYHACTNFRKIAKSDRVLFHYNGHGVPMATANGEIWCFNKEFTQYISFSIMDLQSGMGNPAVFILDCSGAENIVNYWLKNQPPQEKIPNGEKKNRGLILYFWEPVEKMNNYRQVQNTPLMFLHRV